MTGAQPDPPSADGLSEDQRVGHYISMWKQAVEVQQHFNDIEWRIRALALTVATFALGAAGLAVKDRTQVGPLSLGAIITSLGLLLWYAFYFVDRAWYHPLLRAAVFAGTRMEDEIRKSLPEAGMTRAITDGSAYAPSRVVRVLSRAGDRPMQSEQKLVWFYTIGAAALVLVAVLLQLAAFLTNPEPKDTPQPVIVHIDHSTRPEGRQGSP